MFHLKIDFKPARPESLSIESFDLLKVIGKGSFGKVMQVRKKDTQRIYALKTIRKANIAARPGEITHILAERTVLALVNNPFIVPLKFSFQTPDKLYLVMSFGKPSFSLPYSVSAAPNLIANSIAVSQRRRAILPLAARGQVRRAPKPVLRIRTPLCAGAPPWVQCRLSVCAARLQTCTSSELICADSDLKPENILLDYTGHIALCDFGLCKLNMSEKDKTNSASLSPSFLYFH